MKKVSPTFPQHHSIAEDLLEALSSAYEDPGFQRQVHHGPVVGHRVAVSVGGGGIFPHDFKMAGGEALP